MHGFDIIGNLVFNTALIRIEQKRIEQKRIEQKRIEKKSVKKKKLFFLRTTKEKQKNKTMKCFSFLSTKNSKETNPSGSMVPIS